MSTSGLEQAGSIGQRHAQGVWRARKAIAAIALAMLPLLVACNRGDHPQQVMQTAPDFTVQDGAQTLTLSKFRGQVVILNFWATWCASCLDELPSLENLQKQMPGVKIVAVSIDDDSVAYQAFLKQYGISLLSIRDGSAGANLRFGSVRVPESFVIDRNGVIRRKFVGPQDWTSPEIETYLAKI